MSPFEIEEPLKSHPWIETSVCFAVPSKLYGEEVGCALVLSSSCPVARKRPARMRRGSLASSLTSSIHSLNCSLHRTLHLSTTQHTEPKEQDELHFSLHRKLTRRIFRSKHGVEKDKNAILKEVIAEMRAFLKAAKLAPVSDWVCV